MEYVALFLYLCGAVGMYIHLNEENPPNTKQTYLLDASISAVWFIAVIVWLFVILALLIKEGSATKKS